VKTLIVYYSRTGNTHRAAEALKTLLSADVEEITEPTGRGGLLGWIRSGKAGSSEATPEINEPKLDPSSYDVTVVASPVWAGKMASPVRTCLTKTKGKIRRLAALCVSEGENTAEALRGINRLLRVHIGQGLADRRTLG